MNEKGTVRDLPQFLLAMNPVNDNLAQGRRNLLDKRTNVTRNSAFAVLMCKLSHTTSSTFASMSISRKTGFARTSIRIQGVFAVGVLITNTNGGIAFVSICQRIKTHLELKYSLIVKHLFSGTSHFCLYVLLISLIKSNFDWLT